MPTGIDRVELAYLTRFLADDAPCFGLVRTGLGYLLLDRAGLHGLQERVTGRTNWGAPDSLTRLTRKSPDARRVEADFRKHAFARSSPFGLRRLLRQLPTGTAYFNVGHSNLTTRVLSALSSASIGINAFVHDAIPLEYPQFQRPGTVEPFRAKIDRIRQFAELVIYNSADTRRRAERQMAQAGAVPPGIVAHLGTIAPRPDSTELAAGLPPKGAYFVTVGTIEPRKNHAFLLDIWDRMGPDAPPLLICGSRGWNNDAVFARLDALDPDGPVHEVPGLSDPALAALVKGAAGALFPSHAEGFGLPPLEAAMLETRVLCNDLDVFHEFLGHWPVYADVSDQYLWESTIRDWCADTGRTGRDADFQGLTWDAHFNTVLSVSR